MANDELVHRTTLRLHADSHADDIEALNLQMQQMSNSVRDDVELIQNIRNTVHCQQVFNKVTDQLEQQVLVINVIFEHLDTNVCMNDGRILIR